MNLLILDNNIAFAKLIYAKLNDKPSSEKDKYKDANPLNLEDLLLEIEDVVPDIIFMNASFSFGKDNKQQLKGIELLIWLRIKGINCHCVLYSFESFNAILERDIKNFIVSSKGTTFIQLPYDFRRLNLEELKENKSDLQNLKKHLKPAFNIDEFRHREANWWGVKALWDMHKIATKGNFTEEYPLVIKNKLETLNNAVADFLYTSDEVRIMQLVENTKSSISESLLELKNKLNPIEEKIDESNEYDKELQKLIKDNNNKLTDLDLKLKSSKTKDELMFFSEEINKIKDILKNDLAFQNEIKNNFDTAKSQQQKIEEEQKKINKSLSRIFATVNEKVFRKSLPVFNTVVNILYIDDNADNGWKTILQKMIPTANIESIVPDNKYKDDIDKLYEDCIKNRINVATPPNVILLDLRLYDETQRSIDMDNISGRILLDKIRENFLGIPVIMITASNKIWTYEKLMKLGADAYWIKEGVDELRDAEESANNYLDIITCINKCISEKYIDLRSLIEFIEEINIETNLWWDGAKGNVWKNGDSINGDTTFMIRILMDSVYLIKQYLHFFHMGYGYKNKASESFFLSGIIQKICSVFEIAHGVDDALRDKCRNILSISIFDLLDERGDSKLHKIRTLRNDAAHIDYESLNWQHLSKAIKETIVYLKSHKNI
jgi:CheY-like chemotaxis protein